MKRASRIPLAAEVAGRVATIAPFAADDHYSGFLGDYAPLQPMPRFPADRAYLAPDALDGLAQYDAMMVDQPEIFVAPDSKYKGMKPDELRNSWLSHNRASAR